MFNPSDPQVPTVRKQNGVVTFAYRYWTVEHDLSRGGGPAP